MCVIFYARYICDAPHIFYIRIHLELEFNRRIYYTVGMDLLVVLATTRMFVFVNNDVAKY